MSCWQFSMTHCHHCISIIALYQVLPRLHSRAGISLTSSLKIVRTNVPAGPQSILNHLTELLVVRADNKVLTSDFLLAINKCSPTLDVNY